MPSQPSKKPIRVRSLENFPKSAESIDVGLICFEEKTVPENVDLPLLAKATLLSSLDTASYGQAGDMLLYGNETGKALLMERDDFRGRMLAIEAEVQFLRKDSKVTEEELKAVTEVHQVETRQLRHEVKRLAAASEGYLNIRARFLDTFKRDIMGTSFTSTTIRTGNAAAHDGDDLRGRTSMLESKFHKLEATIEASQVETRQLRLEVKGLAAASEGYLKIRARFLDTLKRDIMGTYFTSTTIRTGNAAAHDGDATTDASLYTSRNRTDMPLLRQIYGISYEEIMQLSEADNFEALAIVNCRGTLKANKEVGLPKEVEDAYQLYVLIQMEDPKESPRKDPLKPLGRAYHHFWSEHRQHSLK